jgi:hypothetical protein
MAENEKTSGASLSDLLSALKNVVIALNNATQAYLSVQGLSTKESITAPVVLKPTAGRICVVSVIVAGSSVGHIYDASTLTDTTKALYVIPNTVGVVAVNLVTDYGLLVVPGSGQIVTVAWS